MRFVRISSMWTYMRINKPRSVQYITYANISRGILSLRILNFAPCVVHQMMDSLNTFSTLHKIYTREFTFGNKYDFYAYLTSHIWESSGIVLCEHIFAYTSREAFNIFHTRVFLAEYYLWEFWISHPVSFIKWWIL